jgi:hypothetical protein
MPTLARVAYTAAAGAGAGRGRLARRLNAQDARTATATRKMVIFVLAFRVGSRCA